MSEYGSVTILSAAFWRPLATSAVFRRSRTDPLGGPQEGDEGSVERRLTGPATEVRRGLIAGVIGRRSTSLIAVGHATPVIPGPSPMPTRSGSMTIRHSLQTSCCSISPPQLTWR